MTGTIITTDRLRLRHWTAADREPFARLSADPEVMRHFPSPLARVESDALADRIAARCTEDGFTLYAAELRETGAFLGFIGLLRIRFEAWFTPAVEVGWRLDRAYWNRGLATEGARAVALHAFENLGLEELVSFTAPDNLASRRVMEKIGMRPDGEFEHPHLPEGHRLRQHVLYRLAPTGLISWGITPFEGFLLWL
ncbi:MAG: GNAT family N-acetyltransferase [Bryobacteraceae bacterium]